jgi:palmitoyl-protein thioesterase
MLGLLTRAALLLGTSAALLTTRVVAVDDAHTLPVFFFHGLTANATFGRNLKANLSTEARPLVTLNFCENECSFSDLNNQSKLAIAQIRGIIANDTRFSRGYSFIGHSQGAALARLVIEEMDDHKIHTFISLAGAGNGVFYGPQANDFIPGQTFLRQFSPFIKEPDYTKYTDADISSGRLAIDQVKWQSANPDKPSQLTRSPAKSDWIRYNTLFPKLNNLAVPASNEIIADQSRRKNNFLRLKEAHYFGSEFDETIAPWQSTLNGQYEDIASLAELQTKYKTLKVWSMTETPEYKQDLYGLQTLDKRGGLFLHQLDHVSHECWVQDFMSPRDKQICQHKPVFERSVYPLLAPVSAQEPPVQPHC